MKDIKIAFVAKIKAFHPGYAIDENTSIAKLVWHLKWLRKLPPIPNSIGKRGFARG